MTLLFFRVQCLSRAAAPESYFVTNYLLKVQSQRLEQRNTIWCYTKKYNSSCAASFIDMTDCSGGIWRQNFFAVRGRRGNYPRLMPADWCRPDWCRPHWCPSRLMPGRPVWCQSRLMPVPVDVSCPFWCPSPLMPVPLDVGPYWCPSLLRPKRAIHAKPFWCPSLLMPACPFWCQSPLMPVPY